MKIIESIGLISVFLLLLFSVFLITSQKKDNRSNILFASFLLVTAFDISALFLKWLYAENSFLNILRVASVMLQMPLFYLYVRSACFYNFKLDLKQLLHSIPFFIIFLLFLLTNLSMQSREWFSILAQVQYYGYIIAIFYVLNKYDRLRKENYSNQNKMYQWLMSVTILFLVGNTFVLVRSLVERFYSEQGYPLLNLWISLFGLAVISWFVIKSMRNPDLFTGIDKDIQPLKKHLLNGRSEYSDELDKIDQFMTTYKPYLNDSLTLQKLAMDIGIPEKQLSFLINKVLNKHFFDFINTYRINEAKGLLKKKELNIQQIMYEVGFNSKSSFNTAFKKYTSLTPTKYRALNS